MPCASKSRDLRSLALSCVILASIAPSLARADDPPVAPPATPTATPAASPPAATPPAVEPAPIDPGPLAPRAFPAGDAATTGAIYSDYEHRANARVERIATSRGGLPIRAITLHGTDAKRKLPALLIVGGMDGENMMSTEQVFAALKAFDGEQKTLLESMRVYAIPEANPDARAVAFKTNHPRSTNLRAVDDDRDGTVDEDGPRDINGDGVITMMRRVAPPGRTATHVVDAADPRIVRTANHDKFEVATHEVFVEGLDADADGLMSEDGPGGVDLDRNFPHRYPESARDAGPYQLSEPESLGIAKFVRDHPEIATAIVFGRHDTLAHFPDTKDKDSTGRTPMVYHEDDHALYREFGKLWKDSTKIEKSDTADLAGSLVIWLADHRGITAVAANGWARPELPKLPEGTPAPAETGDGEQAAWLAVSDRMYGGRGFIAWKTFDHPKLGPVEIGGFAPFFRESPTAVQASAIADKSAQFVLAAMAKRPEITVSDVVVTALADGLARIEMRVTNKGTMPSISAMGRIDGVLPPIVVRLALKPDQVLSGRPVEKIERLAAGASVDYQWIVRMPTAGALDITVGGPFFDTLTRTARVGKEASR